MRSEKVTLYAYSLACCTNILLFYSYALYIKLYTRSLQVLVVGNSRLGRVKIPSCIACDRPLIDKVRATVHLLLCVVALHNSVLRYTA